jgi:hypothetical protein
MVACAQRPAASQKIQPSYLEPMEGTDLKRVVLTEKAAERLGIQTTPVHEQEVVRKRAVGGEVVTSFDPQVASVGALWVRVALTESELSQLDLGQLALVLPLGHTDDEEDFDDEEEEALLAEADEGPGEDDPEDATQTVYYRVQGARHGLSPGQRVLIELTLSGSQTPRKVIPYAAVLYDVQGNTWVYTNPEPLVFVREPIFVDYIEGDLVVLLEGPAAGTPVVTVGVAELFGAETGVSK